MGAADHLTSCLFLPPPPPSPLSSPLLSPSPLVAGRQRLLYQLAGVVPSPLLLELLSCPMCARSLESLELELGELETGPRGGDTDGLHHDYTQVSSLGVGWELEERGSEVLSTRT